MSVYQRGDSPYWWMHVPSAPKGKQKRSTGILKGVTGTEQRRTKLEADEVFLAAEKAAARLTRGLPPLETTAPPVEIESFTEHAAYYERHRMPEHRGAYRERQMLPRLVAAFGTLRLNDHSWPIKVTEWRTWRRETPTRVTHYGGPHGRPHTFPCPSVRTVNREVNFLKGMLTYAVELGKIKASPLHGFPNLKGETPVHPRVTPPDEEQRVLRALSLVDRAIYVVARDGLVRLGNTIDLRRPDDSGTELLIPMDKSGAPVKVQVTTRMRLALDAVPIDPDQPEWYFPQRRRARKKEDQARAYIKALKRACERAGVPYGKAAGGVTFHWGTRTTGTTTMIDKGGDQVLKHVQQIGGWKSEKIMMQMYQQTRTEDRRRVAESGSLPAITATTAPSPRLRRVK